MRNLPKILTDDEVRRLLVPVRVPSSGTCRRKLTPSLPPRTASNSSISEAVGALRIANARSASKSLSQ